MVCTTTGSHDPNNSSGPSEAGPKAADELVSGARFDPPSCERWSSLTGRHHGSPSSNLCKIGNHTLPGHLGTISNSLWFPLRILPRVGRISGSGGKAYSSSFCHTWASASWPKGPIDTLRATQSGQCAADCEAKRSTPALPYLCQVAYTTCGCSLHSPGGGCCR